MKAAHDRFMSKYVVDDITQCWNWQASTNNSGYGTFGNEDGISVGAHVWSYEYHVDKIPEGLTVDHTCLNRGCVNPNHMEVVTQKVNVLRGSSPPAINARKTTCPAGHALSGDNLVVYQKGGRQCRECRRVADRKYYRSKRSQRN